MQRTVKIVTQQAAAMPRRKRVCAYARVSSGKDSMLHSLAAQVSHYSKLIQSRPEWEYVGVYADEALTGTKDSRAEFNRMLTDCRCGLIDIIITKSISRFARNTVTLLNVARELKAIGIDIHFEEQGIHTLSGDGELMLTILASYAQEESRSASENCLWRIRERFRNGEPVGLFTMFGYRYADGEFIIHEEEAGVVRMVFADYLAGLGGKRIADKLRAIGVPTVFGGRWTADRVASIIKNEKYTGNSLLQKAYTVDHLSKLRKANRGELPMYYSEGTHPAIIGQDAFDAAQAIMAGRRRPNMVYTGRYPFSSKIVCESCGHFYIRKVTNGIPGWQCSTYLKEGKAACHAVKIREDILTEKAAEALGIAEFDEAAFEKCVRRILVPETYRLVFEMADGDEVSVVWKHRSRSESWTEEMKAAARERRAKEVANGKR